MGNSSGAVSLLDFFADLADFIILVASRVLSWTVQAGGIDPLVKASSKTCSDGFTFTWSSFPSRVIGAAGVSEESPRAPVLSAVSSAC